MRRTALSGCLALYGMLLAGCSDHISSSVPFDRAVWLQGEKAPPSPEAPRLGMADGLVNSQALLGKQREEVEEMLGPDTETDKFRNYDLVYWLGVQRGFMPIDSEWLVLTVDEKGEISDARIVSD